jgi:hypothetical protein
MSHVMISIELSRSNHSHIQPSLTYDHAHPQFVRDDIRHSMLRKCGCQYRCEQQLPFLSAALVKLSLLFSSEGVTEPLDGLHVGCAIAPCSPQSLEDCA